MIYLYAIYIYIFHRNQWYNEIKYIYDIYIYTHDIYDIYVILNGIYICNIIYM